MKKKARKTVVTKLTFQKEWKKLDAELPNIEMSDKEITKEIKEVRISKLAKAIKKGSLKVVIVELVDDPWNISTKCNYIDNTYRPKGQFLVIFSMY